jgi:hypothetical protein
VLGINLSVGDFQLSHTATFRVFQNDFPSFRLRIAFHSCNRHNVIERTPPQFSADNA